MITKISIERRELFADGHEFPITGAYEKLVGKVYGEVDPKNSLNKFIVNVDKAPTNSRRRMEYWADLFILKPVDKIRSWFDRPVLSPSAALRIDSVDGLTTNGIDSVNGSSST